MPKLRGRTKRMRSAITPQELTESSAPITRERKPMTDDRALTIGMACVMVLSIEATNQPVPDLGAIREMEEAHEVLGRIRSEHDPAPTPTEAALKALHDPGAVRYPTLAAAVEAYDAERVA